MRAPGKFLFTVLSCYFETKFFNVPTIIGCFEFYYIPDQVPTQKDIPK